MATVGQALTAPETGWQRIDNLDSNISYVGTWSKNNGTPEWAGTMTNSGGGAVASAIQFNFVGTQLRVIGFSIEATSLILGSPINVFIDGIKVGTYEETYTSSVFQCLFYSLTGLTNKEHCVQLIANDSSKSFTFDAIDIDSTGTIKPYDPTIITTISVPTNLIATGGDAEVTLSWTATTDATGYNVKRATTAGGPYTTVGANVLNNSYVDTAVTNGTTYYYVVTAVNADGESANSNETSATPTEQVTPPSSDGNVFLRVTMSDSGDREFQLSTTEIDGFVNWYNHHVSTDAASYALNKSIGIQGSKEYLAFDKINSFEVMPLTK